MLYIWICKYMDKINFLKVLGDPTRLKIVQLLHQQQTLCVCDIILALQQPQPTISRHLNQLKQVGVLTSERKGTWMWYTINPNMPNWARVALNALM